MSKGPDQTNVLDIAHRRPAFRALTAERQIALPLAERRETPMSRLSKILLVSAVAALIGGLLIVSILPIELG